MTATSPAASAAERKKTAKSPATNKTAVGSKSRKIVHAAHPRGTQTVYRAIAMLREIAAVQKGMRLVDIASAMELERPTAHRIVKGLVSQGMVVQDPDSKCYRLGPMVYELGLAASPYYNLKEVCQPTLERIAQLTEDSVYLVVRSGFDAVCLALVESSYPIRTRTLEVGMRRPLGVGSGGVALMMDLGSEEIERIIAVNGPRLPLFGRIDEAELRDVLTRSRAAGYAINEHHVLAGANAVGVAIPTRGAPPFAALSIAGITARIEGQRREELAQLLAKEARALARRLEELRISWG